MKNRLFAVATLAAVAWSGAASAATSVMSVSYPERQKVELVFAKTIAAPEKAKISGDVRYENGQARIEIKFSGMEPAVLFGGDIAAYVVWAVAKSAPPENLGELVVNKKSASGTLEYATPKKDFAIMITAEPYYLVGKPFDLVIATSSPRDVAKFPGSNWMFQEFRPGPKTGVTSIAGLKYEDKTPVPIRQAETVLALADRLKAGDIAPDAIKSATVALGEAKAARDDKAISDAARRSISSSAEALREWGRTREELAASQAAARSAAEKAAIEQKVASTQQKLTITEEAKMQLEKEQKALTQQKLQLESERAALQQENATLKARLQTALGAVADTRSTARGTVTSLSGVLFDTGKSTLKPEAKITLAKLAGVMLVFSATPMTIEGYTDNVGTEQSNLKLSEARAKAVRDFFESQGIASNRLTYVGKGPADPVDTNDTPEGRAKNRRVEIVSGEPQL